MLTVPACPMSRHKGLFLLRHAGQDRLSFRERCGKMRAAATWCKDLAPAPCAGELFVDGSPVKLLKLDRYNDHDVRVLVEPTVLRNLDDSVRVAGDFCGMPFELDDEGRRLLSIFEARFREERVRGATSGGEAAR